MTYPPSFSSITSSTAQPSTSTLPSNPHTINQLDSQLSQLTQIVTTFVTTTQTEQQQMKAESHRLALQIHNLQDALLKQEQNFQELLKLFTTTSYLPISGSPQGLNITEAEIISPNHPLTPENPFNSLTITVPSHTYNTGLKFTEEELSSTSQLPAIRDIDLQAATRNQLSRNENFHSQLTSEPIQVINNLFHLQVTPSRCKAKDKDGNYTISLGMEVRTTVAIPKGSKIITFQGERITPEEKENRLQAGQGGYIMESGSIIIDSAAARMQGDIASAVNSPFNVYDPESNSSPEANCSLHYSHCHSTFFLRATTQIYPNSILWYDYGPDYNMKFYSCNRSFTVPMKSLSPFIGSNSQDILRRIKALQGEHKNLRIRLRPGPQGDDALLFGITTVLTSSKPYHLTQYLLDHCEFQILRKTKPTTPSQSPSSPFSCWERILSPIKSSQPIQQNTILHYIHHHHKTFLDEYSYLANNSSYISMETALSTFLNNEINHNSILEWNPEDIFMAWDPSFARTLWTHDSDSLLTLKFTNDLQGSSIWHSWNTIKHALHFHSRHFKMDQNQTFSDITATSEEDFITPLEYIAYQMCTLFPQPSTDD